MAQQESPFGPGTDANPRPIHASELSLGADGPADSFADIVADGGGGGVDVFETISDGADLQSALDDAGNQADAGPEGQRLTVAAASGSVLDPGSTITVPPGVTLDARNATFEPSGDYDGFFVDNGARVYVRAITGASYTSRVVYADTDQSTYGEYTGDTTAGGSLFNRGCKIHVEHVNADATSPPTTETDRGTSVELVATDPGSGNATGFGTDVQVEVWSYNTSCAFRAKTATAPAGTPYVNPFVFVSSTWCHTGIKCEGGGDTNFRAEGEIQGGLGAEYGIRNTTGTIPTFDGMFWDPGTYDTAALAGQCNVITTVTGGQAFIGYTDGSNYQTVTTFTGGNDMISVYNASSDSAVRWFMDNVGNVNWETNTGGGWTRVMQLDVSAGDLILSGTVTENGSP